MHKSQIEAIIARLKTDLLSLSVRDNTLSENERHLIHTIDSNLPEIKSKLHMIYQDQIINQSEASELQVLLRDTLNKALKIAKLDEVIEKDETELITFVRNQFVEILRLLNNDLSSRKPHV